MRSRKSKSRFSSPLSIIALSALVLMLPVFILSVKTIQQTRTKASSCTYQAVSWWGTPGPEPGKVNRPQGIFVTDNDVTITEWNPAVSIARVSQFTPSGTFLRSFGSAGTDLNQLHEPVDVVVFPDNILVSDGYHVGVGKVKKIDPLGNFSIWAPTGSGAGQISAAGGMTIDHSGSVYVVDNGNHRIEKFDSQGVFQFAWGSEGSGNGQFFFPRSVATFGDDVYVTDAGNQRIQKFHFNGTTMDFVTAWGSLGSAAGNFNNPVGIATDASGNVYVADMSNHRIQKFTTSGVFIASFGSIGSNPGQLFTPRDVAIDGQGNVVVADTGNNRVQVFTCAVPTLTPTPTPTSIPTSQITHQDTVSGVSTGSTTVSTDVNVTATPDQLYLAAISIRTGSPTLVNSVSGLGLSWSRVASQCSTRLNQYLEVWRAYGSPSTPGKVTAYLSRAPASAIISVSRYSGANPTFPFKDTVRFNTKGINGTCVTSSDRSLDTSFYAANLPTTTGSLVYAAVANRSLLHTPGSGYTERVERHAGSSGSIAGLAVEDKQATAISSQVNGSFSGVVDWAVIGVEVQPLSTAPTPPLTVSRQETVSGGSLSSFTVSTETNVSAVSGNLYLAAISIRSYTAAHVVQSVSGLGLTWTKVVRLCAGRSQQTLEVWKAQGTPTTSGKVTATFNANVISLLAVSRYTGVSADPIKAVIAANTKGVNGSCTGGTDTATYSINLPSLVNSYVYSAAAIRSAAHSSGNGYAEVVERNIGTFGSVAGLAVQDKATNTATTLVNGSLSSNIDWVAIGLNIK